MLEAGDIQATEAILKTVELRPGIRKDITAYQAEGGWVDGNRIRFRDGRAESMGGWVRETIQQYDDPSNHLFTGVARAILPFASLDQKKFLAVATHEKVELAVDGQIYDITPDGLAAGTQDNEALIGWSGGTWNTPGEAGQGWNRPRAPVGDAALREWSLANWGEDLIACPEGGSIYQWDRTNDVLVPMQEISGVPTQNHMIMVTQPSRFLVAFGSQTFAPPNDFDPLIIRWAAEQTLTDWTISSLSTAGEYRIPTGNKIVTAVQTRSEILVFTDVDVYSMRFVGGIDVFQFTSLGNNVSCISQHSPVDINGSVYWMGLDNFYMYDGTIHKIDGTLDRFIFHESGEGRFNFAQKEKVYAGINNEFNEVMWFYPRYDETECQHYIKFNFAENVWDFGTMTRTVWVDKGIFPRPYAIDDTGRLYAQEVGLNDDGKPLGAFILSAYFDIDDGENLMFVNRIVPDITFSSTTGIEIEIYTKKYPHPGSTTVIKGPYLFNDSKHKISFRARGRHLAIRFSCLATGSSFAIGKIRVSSELDGGR